MNRHPSAYHHGRLARERGLSQLANPYQAMTKLWAWWAAGWGDLDIEMTP